MQSQFWVIGADYSDRDFTIEVAGSKEVHGPFSCRKEAHAAWWVQSMAHRHKAMTRFVIAADAGIVPGRLMAAE